MFSDVHPGLTTNHIQNVVSAAGVPIMAGTIWVHAPEWVTLIAGTLGIVWYVFILTEKILHLIHKWKRKIPRHD